MRDGFETLHGVVAPEPLRELAERAFAEFDDEQLPRLTIAQDTLWRSYREWDGLPLRELGEVLDLSGLNAVVETLRGCVEELIRDEVRWRPEASFFRRCQRPSSVVPWHCDAEAAFVANCSRCINVWMPLQVVGDRVRPSLELICGSHLFRRNYQAGHRSASWVSSISGQRLIPVLNAGDALVFDHYLFHRTEVLPAYDAPRLSVELRFSVP